MLEQWQIKGNAIVELSVTCSVLNHANLAGLTTALPDCTPAIVKCCANCCSVNTSSVPPGFHPNIDTKLINASGNTPDFYCE
jgi:hypothetical protein